MSNTKLSEFFSLVSKEKSENLEKLKTKINNPESDLANLFEQLEDAHKETTKVSIEVSDEKILTEEDQNRLEVFSNLVDSMNTPIEPTVEPESIIEPEEPVDETEKITAFEELFKKFAEPTPKPEPEPIVETTPVPEEKIPEIYSKAIADPVELLTGKTVERTGDIIQDIVTSLNDMGEKTEVKKEVDQIAALRGEFDKFRNHIQQHISHQDHSGAGSGEVRLEFLDDVDRDSVKVDGRFLQYNATSKNIEGGNFQSISTSIIPSADDTYDLGSASKQWRNLYLGGSTLVIEGSSLDASELAVLDAITAGTVSASKAVIVDSNKDITGFRNLTIAGDLVVSGTTKTVDTVTMEAENAVVFEGATADAYETTLTIVDPTADRTQYLINQTGYIPLLAASTTTAISSTPAELNLLDGSSANSVVNSKAVIYGSSGEVAGTLSTAAQTNITSLGTLTALTVDDVAVNGKVITMTGSSSDTAVFTSGTNGTLSIVTTDAAAAAANITLTADGTFEADGTTITLDSSGDVVLDADGGDIFFKDAGTTFGSATNTSGDLIIKSGTTTALTFDGANATFAGTVTIGSAEISEAALEILDGATVTTTELNLIDGGTSRGTTAVASGDGILINDAGTMAMTNVDTVSTYFASHSVGGGNIVTTGALDTGSITSGFGTIDTGSSSITTTGVITGGTVEATTDTAVGDNAAIGYTSGEGLILTGQGSTNDVTIKNDADGAVISIPTGTTNVTIAGDLTISGDDLVMGTNTDTAILVADGTNYNPVVPSGDVSLTNAGVFGIASGVIVNADVNASAAIVDTKLATISTANKVALTALDLDGGTDIGAALADADLLIVDDGAGGTNKKTTMARVKTYINAIDEATAIAIALG